ncbi:MAG TPA: isochorismatase family cysteine hydrolase [Marmoricola sp.]|jgi:nicotinamidase-related amidase|nr:isochorismatase family cysteine hydrolase [Marmoricola sp.]
MSANVGSGRTALVVVDMQNDFCHADGVFAGAGMTVSSIDETVEVVNGLVEDARASDVPVVWVSMGWDDDQEVGVLAERSLFLRHEGLRTGTWGHQLLDGLKVSPEDAFVAKKRFSAFYETELSGLLERWGVRSLVVVGVRTDFCVESTVRDAFFRDYRVTVPRDAVAGYFPELHENSLRLMSTVFADVVDSKDVAFEVAVST